MLLRSTYHGSSKPTAREFPISLEMQYQLVSDGTPKIRGVGRTLWISSRQIIFEADTTLSPGTELEITIAWPARLDERVGLQLWVRGIVLHKLSQGVTAEIRKYQFRTRGIARMAAASACQQPVEEYSPRLAAAGAEARG